MLIQNSTDVDPDVDPNVVQEPRIMPSMPYYPTFSNKSVQILFFQHLDAKLIKLVKRSTKEHLRLLLGRWHSPQVAPAAQKLKEPIKRNDRDFPVLGHFLANFFGFFHLRSQDIGED